jgi:hypothetical protein
MERVRPLSDFINPDFVARWEPRYDTRKYPLDFLLRHSASARNAQRPEILKGALLALLHWKDGKARNFVPGESHAKQNTLGPIFALHEAELVEFARLFRCTIEADDKNFVQCTQSLRGGLCGMWSSVVIPAFVLHVARPDRLPIIDPHTLRAYLWLTRRQFVEEPTPTWELWGDYASFFQGAVVSAGFNSDAVSRGYVDRALFAFGKWLKKSYPREKQKLLEKRALTTSAMKPGFTNLWEEILAETASERGA